MSARREFAHDGGGQHLLDAVGERLVLEGRDGDGLDVLGKLHRVTGGVITASGVEQNEREYRQRKQARRTHLH